jgi:hypothetical protein
MSRQNITKFLNTKDEKILIISERKTGLHTMPSNSNEDAINKAIPSKF